MKTKKYSLWVLLIRLTCFILLFFLLLNFFSVVFVPKHENDQTGMVGYISHSFKGEAENSLDVVFIGNSDVYRGVSPMELWDKNGIASCVSGKGGQSVAGAYSILKDLYEKQKPSVVFIETDMLFEQLKAEPASGIIMDRLTKFKKFLSENFKDFDDAASSGLAYYFPLLKYHERWDELKKHDFTQIKASYAFPYKGFISDFNIKGYENGYSYMGKNDGSLEKIDARSMRYLHKMIRLCQRNGSKVVLLEVPSAISWNYQRHNAVQAFADKNGLEFIDMNLENTVPGFDWKTDTKDGGDHLNTFGAQKVSLYLAAYMEKNFSLPDRRQDASYAAWNNALAQYRAELKVNGSVHTI